MYKVIHTCTPWHAYIQTRERAYTTCAAAAPETYAPCPLAPTPTPHAVPRPSARFRDAEERERLGKVHWPVTTSSSSKSSCKMCAEDDGAHAGCELWKSAESSGQREGEQRASSGRLGVHRLRRTALGRIWLAGRIRRRAVAGAAKDVVEGVLMHFVLVPASCAGTHMTVHLRKAPDGCHQRASYAVGRAGGGNVVNMLGEEQEAAMWRTCFKQITALEREIRRVAIDHSLVESGATGGAGPPRCGLRNRVCASRIPGSS